jgi:hypothetical protein
MNKCVIFLSLFQFSVLYHLLFFLLSPIQCQCQFGLLNNRDGSSGNGDVRRPDDIDAASVEDMRKDMLLSAKLQAAAPTISSQDSVDLAALLDALMQDPETKQMVQNLNSAQGREANLQAFSDSVTQQEMVEGLKQTLDEMKALESLFHSIGPERAAAAMIKDGIVAESRIPYYKKNPQQLEEDTRKGLFFSFVSLAVAAGFL